MEINVPGPSWAKGEACAKAIQEAFREPFLQTGFPNGILAVRATTGPSRGDKKKKGPRKGFSLGLCTDTRRFWVRCKMLAVSTTSQWPLRTREQMSTSSGPPSLPWLCQQGALLGTREHKASFHKAPEKRIPAPRGPQACRRPSPHDNVG